MALIRDNAVEVATDQKLFAASDAVDNIVSYFTRQDDRTQIEASIKSLYGYGIKSEKDPAKKDDILETYAKEGFNVRVDNGLVQTISTGFGNKIIAAIATLFTEQGQKFSLTSDSTDDTQEADSLLADNRKEGGYQTALVRTDKLSIQCGSAAVLTAFSGGHTTYTPVGPQNVRAFFADTIEEDGRRRAVDRTAIEESSYVIIRLSAVDVNKWNYLAVYGQSLEHTEGRWVVYQAGNTIEVPEVGSADILEEYAIDGIDCNPLTHFAKRNQEIDVPEYPLSIIYSGITESSDLMPTTSSLYQSCIEFSRSASHTLHKSQEAAASTIAIKTDERAQGKPLPKSLSGAISLTSGQDVESIHHDSAACEAAYKIMQGLMVDVAAGYSVPDYMVVSESMDRNVDQSSGVALQIKTRPLKKFREFRVNENKETVDRLFQIEKAFIGQFHDGDESAVSLLLSCEQTWDAGELKMPENKKEAAERIISLMDKGILDTIAAIREYYQLPTDDEAIEIYNKMKDRAAEFPSLQEKEEPQKKRPGFLRAQQFAGQN